jgi:hypothetical protein
MVIASFCGGTVPVGVAAAVAVAAIASARLAFLTRPISDPSPDKEIP